MNFIDNLIKIYPFYLLYRTIIMITIMRLYDTVL